MSSRKVKKSSKFTSDLLKNKNGLDCHDDLTD